MRRFLASLLLLAACGSVSDHPVDADGAPPPDPPDAAPDAPEPVEPPDAAPPDAQLPPTEDVSVTAFSAAPVNFNGGSMREIEGHADFPAHGPWRKVNMHLTLSCPGGGCDPWDRIGAIGLVDGNTALELARFMTPYGVGGSWDFDLTDFQPLLAGPRTMRAYIDTWVQSGWLVTVRVDFKAGMPTRKPVQVIPLAWKNRERLDRDRVVYGDPARSIPSQLPEQTLTLPASGFSTSELYVITTGHGQGNAGNCAEFCAREHHLTVDGQAHTRTIWRDDCEHNPINNQHGNWQPDRAGWCPGSNVRPWVEDLGGALAPGSTHHFGYDVPGYENTCRPGVSVCTGCVFGTPCDYDGGTHTEPTYLVSAFVILFE
jgi:Peptide-N-glycosidase F, C terminal/Peptide-N-glycosidase F, N terminal